MHSFSRVSESTLTHAVVASFLEAFQETLPRFVRAHFELSSEEEKSRYDASLLLRSYTDNGRPLKETVGLICEAWVGSDDRNGSLSVHTIKEM